MSDVKDKEERRLSKVKISIMRNPKFALWSGLMTVGTTEVTDDPSMPTAGTDGRNEFYNREFIKSLDDKELAFVVLHETLHKAYRHLFTWNKLAIIDKQVTNMACDYVINLEIVDMDTKGELVRVPTRDGKPFVLLDDKYRGMNTKQVFDLLMQDKQNDEGVWGKPSDGDGDGKGDGKGGDGEDSFDNHDWDKAKELTEAEAKELQKEIDQAIRQGIIAHNKVVGSGAGGLPRGIEEMLEPEVDWREVLREFVKATCSAKDVSSWRRPNRRFISNNVYMPSMIGESVGHLVVGVDTSGSIQGKELTEFLTEVKAIADEVHPNKVDLMYWDSEVAGHEEYDQASFANIVSHTRPKGGGGTDPTCMINFMQEKNIKPEAIIMLTDGYIGNWGTDWNAPILWTIVRNKKTTAPCGKTIHIKEN
jgi:predicted metal-dependent peptidase